MSNNIYHPNGKQAFYSDSGNVYHDNGRQAFYSDSGNAYHANGQQAFYADSGNSYFDNGQKCSSNGEGIEIDLGPGIRIFVSSNGMSLYLYGRCIV